MNTQDMQAAVATTGSTLRRETYAGTDSRGRLVSRFRWAVYVNATGVKIVHGVNPRQTFNRWLAKGWKPVAPVSIHCREVLRAKSLVAALCDFAMVGAKHPVDQPAVMDEARLAASALLELQGIPHPSAAMINAVLELDI